MKQVIVRVKVKNEEKVSVDLSHIPTEELLDEIAKRSGIREICLRHELYRDEFDLIHLYHDEPKRHIVAERAFLLNLKYR